jgi:hypothetical protein
MAVYGPLLILLSLVVYLSVFALALESIELSSLPIQFRLVRVYLPLLVSLPLVLTLHLVSDQSSSSQSKRAADSRAGTGMAYRRADNPAHGGAAQSADSRAFFTRRQRSGAAGSDCEDGDKHRKRNGMTLPISIHCGSSSNELIYHSPRGCFNRSFSRLRQSISA